jgi:hypothetical protein
MEAVMKARIVLDVPAELKDKFQEKVKSASVTMTDVLLYSIYNLLNMTGDELRNSMKKGELAMKTSEAKELHRDIEATIQGAIDKGILKRVGERNALSDRIVYELLKAFENGTLNMQEFEREINDVFDKDDEWTT